MPVMHHGRHAIGSSLHSYRDLLLLQQLHAKANDASEQLLHASEIIERMSWFSQQAPRNSFAKQQEDLLVTHHLRVLEDTLPFEAKERRLVRARVLQHQPHGLVVALENGDAPPALASFVPLLSHESPSQAPESERAPQAGDHVELHVEQLVPQQQLLKFHPLKIRVR